jgi:hypothetical protein
MSWILIQYLNITVVLRVEIIFTVPHPSLLLQVCEKVNCNAILVLTQEVKRDIIDCCLNLPPSA